MGAIGPPAAIQEMACRGDGGEQVSILLFYSAITLVLAWIVLTPQQAVMLIAINMTVTVGMVIILIIYNALRNNPNDQ